MTLTKFQGDIQFQKSNSDVLVSSLPTMEDVNNAISTAIDGNFTIEEGNAYYTVKNSDLHVEEHDADGHSYYDLQIRSTNLPLESLKKCGGNLFRIILRKNVIYDQEGYYIKEFSIKSANNTIVCPVITYNSSENYSTITTIESDVVQISFDKSLTFDGKAFHPINEYQTGYLSIMTVYNLTSLLFHQPVVKCNMIEAKNALKLHESDILYLYKPTKITEEAINGINFYKMVFNISEYDDLPENSDFVFKEFCFGNTWSLTWHDGKWNGNNCKGKFNQKVLGNCGLTSRVWGLTDKKFILITSTIIMIKDDAYNRSVVPDHELGLMYSLWNMCTKKLTIEHKDGSIHDASEYSMEARVSWDGDAWVKGKFVHKFFQNQTKVGYSTMPIVIGVVRGLDKMSAKNYDKLVNQLNRSFLDLTLPNTNESMRLVFRFQGSWNSYMDPIETNENHDVTPTCYFGTVGEKDSIERVVASYSESHIDPTTRNISLYFYEKIWLIPLKKLTGMVNKMHLNI